ncbi:FBD-associated F-box protein At5g22730 [Gossypium hirsutum]|uniref:FBD-associated F-box protein At5g22730 n=1 Tax=Gossypium hirsutum TaxID=3635 RepID=A0A1U8KMA8_GOSHI|nr:FBD-associated F-box protein At5g22730-like [Gossypium hirsutum]
MGNMSNINISHHLLKRWTILHSYTHYFMIDTPNLANFKSISHEVTGYSLKNLESIVSADIHFVSEYNYLQADATALFRGICNVRSLVLSATSLMALTDTRGFRKFSALCQQKVPCCLLYKLKTIKITNFTDEKDRIGKAEYILKNGGALQKLTIRTGLYISEEEKLEIYQVLLASPRKSNQCRILFI